MGIRHVFFATLLIGGGYFLHAQAPVAPTSATDASVKVHKRGKIFLFRSSKKKRGQVRSNEVAGQPIQKIMLPGPATVERKGQPIHKSPRYSHRSGKESRTFKRHNHFAKKDNGPRSRSRRTKKV